MSEYINTSGCDRFDFRHRATIVARPDKLGIVLAWLHNSEEIIYQRDRADPCRFLLDMAPGDVLWALPTETFPLHKPINEAIAYIELPPLYVAIASKEAERQGVSLEYHGITAVALRHVTEQAAL
jgi:hypothetical protein